MSPALNQYTLQIEQHLYFQIYLYVIFHIKLIFYTFAALKDMNCGNYCILSHIFKWVYLALPGARVRRLGVRGAGSDEYPLLDPTRTFFLLPEPDPNYFS